MPPAQPTMMGHQHGPSQLKRVYKISFSIEKPQTTFCGLGNYQGIYKPLQQPGCPSGEHVHVGVSGQARDALVKEEVSSIHGHLDTLHSAPLDLLKHFK